MDGGSQSHGGGKSVRLGKHSSLLTPQGKATITQQLPPTSGSSWRGRICPHAGAACPGPCTSTVCPLCHNYTEFPPGCPAQRLSQRAREGSLLPGAAELTLKPDPQLPPRPSVLCCWQLGWTGRPLDFALLWCCHSQRVSGWQDCFPTHSTPGQGNTPLQKGDIFTKGSRAPVSISHCPVQ